MSNIEYMNECMARDLITMLMEDQGMEMEDAIDTLYNSETYAKLKDPDTGLYFQSAVYVYDYLKQEITTGKLA
ncbi:MAG: hypothetical protein J6W24_04365 [Prevotella sp.]|nr:hypothetical protein [Prevotella sp.]